MEHDLKHNLLKGYPNYYKKHFTFLFSPHIKNNVKPNVRLKERIETLIQLEPYSINRINLVLSNTIGELNLMIARALSIFNDIGIEIVIYKKGQTSRTKRFFR